MSRDLPLYRPCRAAGRLHGPIMASMRPIPAAPGHIFTTDIRDTPWQV